MAITAAEYAIWTFLRESGHIPKRPSLLQIGEANWYGDVPFEQFISDCAALKGQETAERLQVIIDSRPVNTDWLFDAAELFHEVFLDPSETTSIDLNGTHKATRLDLNERLELAPADIVINTGTAEHVWRVSQVFELMHAACKPSGLMVHCFPFRGLLDHGFWSMNPTLIMDLEYANGYQRLAACYYEMGDEPKLVWLQNPMHNVHDMAKKGELGENAFLYVVWRKNSDADFVVPYQGMYCERLTPEQRKDWFAMR